LAGRHSPSDHLIDLAVPLTGLISLMVNGVGGSETSSIPSPNEPRGDTRPLG
jgi:hypothetical protein